MIGSLPSDQLLGNLNSTQGILIGTLLSQNSNLEAWIALVAPATLNNAQVSLNNA